MVNIRKQYAKLKINILKDIEKVISGQKEDYEDDTYSNIRDYKFCIVGTVRERLGLGNDYTAKWQYNETYKDTELNLDYCSKCKELADQFPNPIEQYPDFKSISKNEKSYYHWEYERQAQEQKEKYEALLCELKQHLVLDHKKRIDV